MSSKSNAKDAKAAKATALRVFPTNIAMLDKPKLAQLAFKPEGMASEVIQALKRHGSEAGDARKKVVEQVKVKFPKAHEATIRTQVYRGIVYLRASGRLEQAK